MKKINENQLGEALHSIKRVEANPFLLTRIQERIKQGEVASAPLVWAMGFSFILVLAINIIGFSKFSPQEISQAPQTELYNLLPQNSLYD